MQVKKRHFWKQISAVVILAIFSLAITPLSALHHHEENIPIHEKNCTHTVHVKTSSENCLVCKAHFEKHFISDFRDYIVYLKANLIEIVTSVAGNSFSDIISSCLRGPPTE